MSFEFWSGQLLRGSGSHGIDPDFGSTSTASNRDSQPNCWANLKNLGQPCEFQVGPRAGEVPRAWQRAAPVRALAAPASKRSTPLSRPAAHHTHLSDAPPCRGSGLKRDCQTSPLSAERLKVEHNARGAGAGAVRPSARVTFYHSKSVWVGSGSVGGKVIKRPSARVTIYHSKSVWAGSGPVSGWVGPVCTPL